jgi:hypothetical protein
MKFSVKSFLTLFFVATAAQAPIICSSQLDYLHKVADQLEHKVFCDTVSTIEYRENISHAWETFAISLTQKPCLVVGDVVKRVLRTVSIRDGKGDFVHQRSYVVDCTAPFSCHCVNPFALNSVGSVSNRYLYSLKLHSTVICKLDTQTGKTVHWAQANCYLSEPIFMGNPGGQREDDGVLISVVFDAQTKKSFLLFLNARSLKEITRTLID